MGIKVMKHIYQRMIDQNIEWLKANTEDCLERQHIICILNNSVKFNYPEKTHDKQANQI